MLAIEGPGPGDALGAASAAADGVAAAGPMPLRRLAAMLAHCRALVCNDTGIMHVAASVGTPVVAIFGPTWPPLYLPSWGPAEAARAPEPCPWRKTGEFGPPECVRHGLCLAQRDGCVDTVTSAQVLASLRALVARTAAGLTTRRTIYTPRREGR